MKTKIFKKKIKFESVSISTEFLAGQWEGVLQQQLCIADTHCMKLYNFSKRFGIRAS